MENIELAIRYLGVERTRLMKLYREHPEKLTEQELGEISRAISKVTKQKNDLHTLLKDLYGGSDIIK